MVARSGYHRRHALFCTAFVLFGNVLFRIPVSALQNNATTTSTSPTTVPATPTDAQDGASTIAATTTELPSVRSTVREPSEQEINEARKIIHEIASTIKDPNRLVLNKPILNQAQDFAPDSPEAQVASATTQFGLNFIKSLSSNGPRNNVVISPVSLQVLLNIVLLGSKHGSETQMQLARVLGYESNDLSPATNVTDQRDRAHAAMHSLLENISRATHLSLDEQQQQLLNSNPQLAAHLQTTARDDETTLTGQVNFTLANLMLTNQDLIKTDQNYEQDLKRFYDIRMEHFSKLSNSTATTTKNQTDVAPLHMRVNSWVQNITQGQIGKLVEESDLAGGDLAMILLNAAHFKARWLHTFNSKLTQERVFYNEGQDGNGQEVKFMRQNGVFGYAEFGGGQSAASSGDQQATGHQTSASDETVLTEDLATGPQAVTSGRGAEPGAAPVVELSREEARRYELTSKLNCSALLLPFSPRDGQELSMVVLLPSKRDGLEELMTNLDGAALNEIYRSLNEQQVQVEMPKFSFESSHDAKATLLKIGLTRVFQDGAELDRMLAVDSPNRQLTKVDKVVHKAKVTVDELGAEASAASAATIVLRNLIRPPNPSFVADHPFLFIIRHNRSNLPLFMGRIDRL